MGPKGLVHEWLRIGLAVCNDDQSNETSESMKRGFVQQLRDH
jgi:hypothetical protein